MLADAGVRGGTGGGRVRAGTDDHKDIKACSWGTQSEIQHRKLSLVFGRKVENFLFTEEVQHSQFKPALKKR